MDTRFDIDPGGGDSMDAMLGQWQRQRPQLDVSSGGVIGRVLRAARLTEELMEDGLRRQEGRSIANVGDLDVLLALRRASPPYVLTPGQLRESLIVSSAGLSGRLKRLERAGWINRTASPDDRRSSRVSLTEDALPELDRRIAAYFALERNLVSVLEPEEKAAVADALRKLLVRLETAP
ncbi:MarR family winged helix-turn-helix transcriptional regulator [Streptomyces sp. NPDC059861]|uniref:MarR family winged helix-turn-helix transcriptional regulator n=1 Tax=Streptomyces sp. NPDC059861 TaxID=3346974 RepID=UPI00365673B3